VRLTGSVVVSPPSEYKRGPRSHGDKCAGAAVLEEVENENAKLLGAIPTGINHRLPYAQFGS